MRIGEKIHRIRRERGHTAEQFAETLGISTVSLRKHEYGERTPKEPMITEIERCLKVNPHLSSPTGETTRTMRFICCSSWRKRFAWSQSKSGALSSWLFGKTWIARIRKHWQGRFIDMKVVKPPQGACMAVDHARLLQSGENENG